MADSEAKKAPATKPPQPTGTGQVGSIPTEPDKPYVLGTIDWASIGKEIEKELSENKVWSEKFFTNPDLVQGVIYRMSINHVMNALPSKEE